MKVEGFLCVRPCSVSLRLPNTVITPGNMVTVHFIDNFGNNRMIDLVLFDFPGLTQTIVIRVSMGNLFYGQPISCRNFLNTDPRINEIAEPVGF